MCCLQDLDNETLAHIDAENRRQTLEEQIEFLKSIHDQVWLHTLRRLSAWMLAKYGLM